jgi:hypothetical protein
LHTNQIHDWDNRELCFENCPIGPIGTLLWVESFGNAHSCSQAPSRKELLEGRTWSIIAVRVADSLALSRLACSLALDDDRQKSYAIRVSTKSTKPYQKTKDMEKFIRKKRSAKIYQGIKICRTRFQDERPEKHLRK